MLSLSLQTCNTGTGACVMTWHWGEFGQQLSLYHTQFLTSIYFAGAATIIDLIVSFPIAYWIAFHGGTMKNFFLLMLLRSEEHTSELQSHLNLVCRLLLEKKKKLY